MLKCLFAALSSTAVKSGLAAIEFVAAINAWLPASILSLTPIFAPIEPAIHVSATNKATELVEVNTIALCGNAIAQSELEYPKSETEHSARETEYTDRKLAIAYTALRQTLVL